jgi:ectoine hydroxylase-related dioxygenase (phytanoyl-CoA dioxygenase family)
MTRPIFRNPAHQASFDRLGYVMHDFLDADELADLNGLFDKTVRQERTTCSHFSKLLYYISIFDQDVEKRKTLNLVVRSMFREKVARLMVDYRILLCNFMAKQPGGGEIEVHQDFSFVDEDRFTGFNLWVPLEHTDEGNGCFYMVPGSHKVLPPSHRSASAPDTLTRYNETLKRYMEPKPVKAGSGLLFDHRLFHYSPSNVSDRWRPAVQLVVIPQEAEPVIMRYDKDRDPDNLQVCRIDEQYLTEENIWQPERELQVVGSKPYVPLPSEGEIVALVESLRARLDTTDTRRPS